MIRVIIDRRLKPGTHAEVGALLNELRSEAIQQKDYISGESLQSTDDLNHIVVISSWHNEEAWKQWKANVVREELEGKIGELLAEPEQVTVFQYVHSLGSTPPRFSLMA